MSDRNHEFLNAGKEEGWAPNALDTTPSTGSHAHRNPLAVDREPLGRRDGDFVASGSDQSWTRDGLDTTPSAGSQANVNPLAVDREAMHDRADEFLPSGRETGWTPTAVDTTPSEGSRANANPVDWRVSSESAFLPSSKDAGWTTNGIDTTPSEGSCALKNPLAGNREPCGNRDDEFIFAGRSAAWDHLGMHASRYDDPYSGNSTESAFRDTSGTYGVDWSTSWMTDGGNYNGSSAKFVGMDNSMDEYDGRDKTFGSISANDTEASGAWKGSSPSDGLRPLPSARAVEPYQDRAKIEALISCRPMIKEVSPAQKGAGKDILKSLPTVLSKEPYMDPKTVESRISCRPKIVEQVQVQSYKKKSSSGLQGLPAVLSQEPYVDPEKLAKVISCRATSKQGSKAEKGGQRKGKGIQRMNVEGVAQIYITDSEKVIQARAPNAKQFPKHNHQKHSPGKPIRKTPHTMRSISDPNFRSSGRPRKNRLRNTKASTTDTESKTTETRDAHGIIKYPSQVAASGEKHANTTYWWQIGPDVDVMMEERRQQLLEIGDLSDNDELVEEWLALLLAREELMAAQKSKPSEIATRHTANELSPGRDVTDSAHQAHSGLEVRRGLFAGQSTWSDAMASTMKRFGQRFSHVLKSPTTAESTEALGDVEPMRCDSADMHVVDETVGTAVDSCANVVPEEKAEANKSELTADGDRNSNDVGSEDPTLKLIQEQNQILSQKDRQLDDIHTRAAVCSNAVSDAGELPTGSVRVEEQCPKEPSAKTTATTWSKRLWGGLKRTSASRADSTPVATRKVESSSEAACPDNMTLVPLDDDNAETELAATTDTKPQRVERLHSVDLFPAAPIVQPSLFYSNRVAMVSSAFKTQYIVKESAPFTKEALCHLAMKKKWIDNNGSVLPRSKESAQKMETKKPKNSDNKLKLGVSSLVAKLRSQKSSKDQGSTTKCSEGATPQPNSKECAPESKVDETTGIDIAATHLHRPASDYNKYDQRDPASLQHLPESSVSDSLSSQPMSQMDCRHHDDNAEATGLYDTAFKNRGQTNPIHRVCFEPPADVRSTMAVSGDLGICLVGLTISKVPQWATESGLCQGDTILKVNGIHINDQNDFCNEIVRVGKTFLPIVLDVVTANVKCAVLDV
eukprot:m.1106097 g.1106097  ORF g.1106097 m.1106097 type:complete len:1138 (+) comp24341_c0_seq12:1-3414(+)